MPISNPSEADYGPTSQSTPRHTYGSSETDYAPHTTPTKAAAAAPDDDADPNSRKRYTPKKQEPTLLTDFFMGRQTPARIAADQAERKRRQIIEAANAVRREEETKQEVKQSAVRKLQQPGGVRERVKLWHKLNHSAATSGDPRYAATEPSDVAFDGEEVESVTEEERVRIKMRLKRRPVVKMAHDIEQCDSKSSAARSEATQDDTQSIPPPKRLVSDDNWMRPKPRKVTPKRKISPTLSRSSNGRHRIPSNFLSRPVANMPVSNKVKAWAAKVERPDEGGSSSKQRKTSNPKDSSKRQSDNRKSFSSIRTPQKPAQTDDDGIRIRPIRKKAALPDDDGIRVVGSNPSSVVRDDGIRVRPTATDSDVSFPGQTYRPPRQRSKSQVEASEITDASTQSDLSSTLTASRPKDKAESLLPDTPTKSRGTKPSRARAKSYMSGLDKDKGHQSTISGETSVLSSTLDLSSDLGSNLTAKSLADIPGDIPFGHSAFSELDLTVGGTGKSRPKKPKVERKSSLKGVPNVLKKVMEEGKKIIQEMNEPPRPQIANNPPSIEKWLSTSFDPFVDSPAGKEKKSPSHAEEESKQSTPNPNPKSKPTPTESRRADKSPPTLASTISDSTAETAETSETKSSLRDTEVETSIDESSKEPAKQPESPTTPKSAALKRSRATRASFSPIKSSGKREFLGMLKQAFQGESTGYTPPPKTYQSHEERKLDTREVYDPTESMISSSYVTESDITHSELSQETSSTTTDGTGKPTTAVPMRFRPPTNGKHELSTIMSESDEASTVGSDLSSRITESTLTQSTVLTKDSGQSSPKQKQQGLQRRLTRHSDLVSVLSLPDNNGIPEGIKNNRSRPSLRRNKGSSSVDVTADELLKEFTDDENLYLRELKTLVDGVIPVLLSHVVGDGDNQDLFASTTDIDTMSKAVVKMGVALEKLKTAHKKAPTSDFRRLAHWTHGVIPIYSNYVSAWRLGFQDVVVNLAPPEPGRDEEDSLLDALPRNEKGDIVNSSGERVAVAHLLKRPLVRIKQLTKLVRCADDLFKTQETQDLVRDFENLQDRTRRRHREEIARMTDDDATKTDATRARDPRTFVATDTVLIDPSLQVNAKDVFSLDLAHSNGQRLECQVEVIYRDCARQPDREGELLIREIGDNKRTYLLFPPLPISTISSRTGDGNFDMVLMIRGKYRGKQWHELITLYTDNEDQILDWLDLLPVSPVPPREPEPSIVGDGSDEIGTYDAPVGAQFISEGRPLSPLVETAELPRTPPMRASIPHTSSHQDPKIPDLTDLERTPTQDDYRTSNLTLEEMLPKPLNIRTRKSPKKTEFKDDGAPPPPPVHRIDPAQSHHVEKDLGPESTAQDSLKRRGSSPLKHEYLPSNTSSASGTSVSEESDSYSSDDDDIDSMDIPETDLGISIANNKNAQPTTAFVDSNNSASDCSVTPSNSASQAAVYQQPIERSANITQYLASISRWSDKGLWKDISPQPCSIVVSAGLIEAFAFRSIGRGRANSVGASNGVQLDEQPLIALDLTPLVLIRQSTALDLEVRSSVQSHSKLYQTFNSGNFRFRCHNAPECFALYMSVHHARLQNQKFIQLENEARFRSFGERKPQTETDGQSSGQRRSWFGRKNSYRGSVRAPSQSQDGGSVTPSSTPSATSFLKKLTVSGNTSFNLARSSVDRQNQGSSGQNSLYTSGSSSRSRTPPRSPSISLGNSDQDTTTMNSEHIRIRLHLLVSSTKWEDHGNCILQIRRPPPGWRQALRADHGLEKRITVITVPRKEPEQPKILLDAVLGSGCFSPMGVRGIVCGIWEEVKGSDGVIGSVPATGATGGNIKKWCFQCNSATEANWVMRLVHQEVLRA